ncbi:carbohydrate kinase family protein [Halobacteriales archaeon QH_2_65_14]|nr:MAG: carbohydrate kinase family protein [Halobacteriales archaeon QH_2_65_14]
MTARVVGVGNAHLDLTHVVTSIPSPDDGAFATDRYESSGGVEANVAVGLSRLGHDAAVIARLGDDEYADRVVELLRAEGVDVGGVRIEPGDESSYCLVLRTREGERVIVGGGNSILRLQLREADLETLSAADVAVTSGYTPAMVLQALVDRPADGVAVAFDLAGTMDELRERGYTRSLLDRTLPGVDLFVSNESAARSYLDGSASPVATLRDRGIDRGALTRGERGATLWSGETVVDVPAYDVDVTETTGAGDAFTAGLVDAWLLDGRPPEDAGQFAAATAALNTRRVGAQGGLPDRSAVDRWMASHSRPDS